MRLAAVKRRLQMKTMIDVQKSLTKHDIAINRVGVSKIKYPIFVTDRQNNKQQTVAEFNMSVDLSKNSKGTHMSRFVEILKNYHNNISHRRIIEMTKEIQTKLESANAYLKADFPFFVDRKAPVSSANALLDYHCFFDCAVKGENINLWLGVSVPVTSLCPCSKTISEYGAHNQRGVITIDVELSNIENDNLQLVYFEELFAVAEESASSQLYPILKRPDEKYVTEFAYDNPVFVEDMVRNVANQLRKDPRIKSYKINCENFESIHNHSAFAEIIS